MGPLKFVATLYIVRWLVLIPYMLIGMILGESSGVSFNGSPLTLLFGFLILSPVSKRCWNARCRTV